MLSSAAFFLHQPKQLTLFYLVQAMEASATCHTAFAEARRRAGALLPVRAVMEAAMQDVPGTFDWAVQEEFCARVLFGAPSMPKSIVRCWQKQLWRG